jgi:hypothetical protein
MVEQTALGAKEVEVELEGPLQFVMMVGMTTHHSLPSAAHGDLEEEGVVADHLAEVRKISGRALC